MNANEMVEIILDLKDFDGIENESIIAAGKAAATDIIKNDEDFFSHNDQSVYLFLDGLEFEDEYYIREIDKYVPKSLGLCTAWSKYFDYIHQVYTQCLSYLKYELME